MKEFYACSMDEVMQYNLKSLFFLLCGIDNNNNNTGDTKVFEMFYPFLVLIRYLYVFIMQYLFFRFYFHFTRKNRKKHEKTNSHMKNIMLKNIELERKRNFFFEVFRLFRFGFRNQSKTVCSFDREKSSNVKCKHFVEQQFCWCEMLFILFSVVQLFSISENGLEMRYEKRTVWVAGVKFFMKTTNPTIFPFDICNSSCARDERKK